MEIKDEVWEREVVMVQGYKPIHEQLRNGDVGGLCFSFATVTLKEIKKKDWLFDWGKELKDKGYEVYKMTTVENKNIIQGLISLEKKEDYVFINLVESAFFNRGKDKMYEGVGGNLFAFACKTSNDLGFGGFVSFISKTALMKYYHNKLGATKVLGQRMVILDKDAMNLINQYFKNK